MATLQKFKLLATQCAVVAGSPTRSPTTSPVIHLRRRKTLRMFLTRGNGSNSGRRRFQLREQLDDDDDDDDDTSSLPNRGDRIGSFNTRSTAQQVEQQKRRDNHHHQSRLGVRHKLKDLFVSSPPIDVCNGDVDDGTRISNAKKDECRTLLPPRSPSYAVGSGYKGGSGNDTGGGAVVVRRVGNGNLRPLSATLRQRLLRRAWRPVLVAIPEQVSP